MSMTISSAEISSKIQTASPRRSWFWLICQTVIQGFFGIWLRYRAVGVDRIPTTGGGLLLCNHQSYLDPLLVGLHLARPVSYLARNTLFAVPILGRILRITHVMSLNRDGGSSAAIREALKRMDEGFLVGIFPEGTRSADGHLGPLKHGFAAILRRTDLPVIPVGIAGANRALGRGSWFLKPCRVCVVYGEPLPREEIARLNERGRERELVELVRTRIAACQHEAESILAQRRSV